MSLNDDIADVLDHIEEPEQIVRFSKSYGGSVSMVVPRLKVRPGSKNPVIAKMLKSRPSYSRSKNKLVINKNILSSDLKNSVMTNVIEDISKFLDTNGVGKRTKFNKWFKNNRYSMANRPKVSEDVYQIWKYLKTDDSTLPSVKIKNIIGLLSIIHKKYQGSF